MGFFARKKELQQQLTRSQDDVQSLLNRMNEMRVRAAFNAAETHRMNAAWRTNGEHINTTLNRELAIMRNRSRWLARNNPYASGALNNALSHCVGTGYILEMEASTFANRNGEVIETDQTAYNNFIEDGFEAWSSNVSSFSAPCCPDSMHDLETLFWRLWHVDGELFIHFVIDRSSGTVPLRLEIIDPSLLDSTVIEHNGNPVVMGVELHKQTTRPVAYHVYTSIANDPFQHARLDSQRIPAESMIHHFIRTEPHQVRGIPFVSPVTDQLYQIHEYTNAQIVRNKIASMFGVLLKGDDALTPAFSSKVKDDPNAAQSAILDVFGNPVTSLSPGMMGVLPDGVDPVMVTPTEPSQSYEAFLQSMLISVAGGIQGGMSYASMTRDTSNSTFSSGQQSKNLDTQSYRPLMATFARKVLSQIFLKWHETAILSGALDEPPGFDVNPTPWLKHTWTPPGWANAINPVQDITAAKISMDEGLSTFQDECALRGKSWRKQLRKKAKAEVLAKELGTTLGGQGIADQDLFEMAMQESKPPAEDSETEDEVPELEPTT